MTEPAGSARPTGEELVLRPGLACGARLALPIVVTGCVIAVLMYVQYRELVGVGLALLLPCVLAGGRVGWYLRQNWWPRLVVAGEGLRCEAPFGQAALVPWPAVEAIFVEYGDRFPGLVLFPSGTQLVFHLVGGRRLRSPALMGVDYRGLGERVGELSGRGVDVRPNLISPFWPDPD